MEDLFPRDKPSHFKTFDLEPKHILDPWRTSTNLKILQFENRTLQNMEGCQN